MAEPGPDCSSLLDEDLSSFVFSYLADSQVGRAGWGGLCCAGPGAVRLEGADGQRRTGTDPDRPPRCLPGHPGEEPVLPERGCGARLARRGCAAVPFSLRGCGAARGLCAPLPGLPGGRSPAAPPALSAPLARGLPRPPVPPSAGKFGGEREQVDGLMGFGTEAPSPPRLLRFPPEGGEGAARCGLRRGLRGGGRWSRAWDESFRASVPRIRVGILGDGGLGRGGATAGGVSVPRVSRSKMLDGLCFGRSWVLKSD